MFLEPDWLSSVDFAARIAAVPPDAVVRGMFLQVVANAITRGPKAKSRYVAFKTYPMREYLELLAAAAQEERTISAAECVRRVGWRVYTTYAQTLTGTAIFAIAGLDFRRVIEVAPSSYKVALTPGNLRVRSIENHQAEVELRDVYNLPDLHQVGIWEGAMKACGVTGQVRTRVINFGAVDFQISWQPRGAAAAERGV
jgi:uncharacterized protein (TIGR02265 family)